MVLFMFKNLIYLQIFPLDQISSFIQVFDFFKSLVDLKYLLTGLRLIENLMFGKLNNIFIAEQVVGIKSL